MESDSSPTSEGSKSAPLSATSTRRRLLRTTVNLGVGGALVWNSGYSTTGGTVDVVYAHARPTPETDSLVERSKPVPADWYDSLQTAFAVQRRLGETELSSLVGSFVVPGSYDDPAASLDLEATSDGIREEIDEFVEDIPIDVDVVDDLEPPTEEPRTPGSPFEVSNLVEPVVPGGVVCESSTSSGTLAPAIYDARSGERYFATSNHVYGEEGTLEGEHEEHPLYVSRGDRRRRIGRVERGYPVEDVVRVEPVDGYEPASEIAHAEPSTVIGQYTRVGLADLMARDEELEKFGSRSGRTSGTILGVDGATCFTADFCRSGQLRWGGEDTMTSGDSGSVNYHPDPENPDEYLLVGGINNARTWWPGGDYTWGTAAYQLLAERGIHF